jgi:hypothetical protein
MEEQVLGELVATHQQQPHTSNLGGQHKMSLYLGNTPICGGIEGNQLSNPFSLLDYKFSEYEISNASWLRSNGQYNSGTTYADVYNLLLQIYNGTVTKAGVSVKLSTETYEDTDFVLNTSDTTFRLPLKVALASGKAVAGNGKTLGLTDGTNNYGLQRDYYSSTGSYNQAHTGSYGKDIGASRESYTNSVTTTLGITLDSTKSGIETSADGLYLYFYVGAVVQDANLINAGQVLNDVANLKNATNFSQLGKETIVGWGMPDYTAGVSKTWNTDITTTQDVRVCYGGASQNSPSDSIRLYINGNLVGNYIIANAGVFMQWVDIPAGVTYKVTGGQWGQYITEYPFLGE